MVKKGLKGGRQSHGRGRFGDFCRYHIACIRRADRGGAENHGGQHIGCRNRGPGHPNSCHWETKAGPSSRRLEKEGRGEGGFWVWNGWGTLFLASVLYWSSDFNNDSLAMRDSKFDLKLLQIPGRWQFLKTKCIADTVHPVDTELLGLTFYAGVLEFRTSIQGQTPIT